MTNKKTIGRYAPSPTGDLHLGNLRTALIAWLHSRLQGGQFVLRIEDLDTPRTVIGSADRILHDLEWLGLDWDAEVVYQSQRQSHYQEALEYLQSQDLVYECFCSRKDIQNAASAPHSSYRIYPGTCAALSIQQRQLKAQNKAAALRVRVTNTVIAFDDGCLGYQQQNLRDKVSDFVIKRADSLFAYQLAVVVDDLQQGITDVVRGADLIDSTAPQLYLANVLQPDQVPPDYWHVPLLMTEGGLRMAKRDGSQSAQNWRNAGGSSQQLVGEFAAGLGLCPSSQAISLSELRDSLDFQTFVHALRKNSNER